MGQDGPLKDGIFCTVNVKITKKLQKNKYLTLI